MNTDKHKPEKVDKQALEEAFDWLIKLDAQPDDDAVKQAWSNWVEKSESHLQAWQKAEKTWRLTAQLPKLEPQKSLASASIAATSKRTPTPWSQHKKSWFALGMAACLAIFTLPTLKLHLTADYITSTGKIQQIELEDGSKVYLSAASAIATDFHANKRTVKLLEGQAFFEIAHNAQKPFVVEMDGLQVTVLGTAFDVRESDSVYAITVQNGQVGIESPARQENNRFQLSAGQRLTVQRSTGQTLLSKINPRDVALWREGVLFLEETTVKEAIEILQRYYPGEIVLADSSMEYKKITGVYNLKQPEKALQALVAPFQGHVHRVPELISIVTL